MSSETENGHIPNSNEHWPENIVINVESDNSANNEKENIKMEELKDNSNGLLEIPRQGHRRSFMEEQSYKEKLRVSLLKQCSAILKQAEQRYTKESFHRTFQDEDLLERIFNLFDLEKNEYLMQEDWIDFLKQRLTEEKQLELVQQLECEAYVLCGTDVITCDQFKQILSNKVVTHKVFRVVDTDGDGYTTADEIMEFLAVVSSTRSRVGCDKLSVERLEQLFRDTVGDQKEITMEQFKKIVVSKNPFFTERVFQIFDEDDSGTISLQEFITAVHGFATAEDKLRFLFRVYDLDGNGLIQHRELQAVMRACMEENGMQFSDLQLEELTEAMFEDADVEKRGAITYEAFQLQLMKHDGLLENLTITIDRWLLPPPKPEKKTLLQRLYKLKPYQLSMPYFRNNTELVGYLTVFFTINICLFVARCIEYRSSNGYVIVARACGQCLNFTCSWILVLMLRHSITWLRAKRAGTYLPLDHHVYLHKLTGVMVFGYSILHTVMHLCNFSLIVVNDPVINSSNYTLAEWLITTRPGLFGLVGGCANPTGVGLVLALLVMFICSQPFIRRTGYFEVFYWTHLLYVPFWLLLIFHGPNFWKWFIVPGLLYAIERIIRLAWTLSGSGETHVVSGLVLPSRVTHLVVARPPRWTFRAGDYVFVRVPAVAAAEWHPFTISSAPEQTDFLWLHIRGVGQWTNRLYSYFEQEQERLHQIQHDNLKIEENGNNLRKTSVRSIKSKGSFKKRLSEEHSYTNNGFVHDGAKKGDIELSSSPMPRSLLSPLKLEKTQSMPDMNNAERNKLRISALRDYTRAVSEKNLRCGTRRNRCGSHLAYRSERHKALAHSFRYMRNKPIIITFKAPTDEYDRRRSNESILTVARRRLSKSISPDKVPEQPEVVVVSPSDKSTDDPSEISYPIAKPLKIYLDGPYGAPSSDIFGAEHAALVAAGIGVTPFASLLQAIMLRHWRARVTCPRCGLLCRATWPQTDMNLRKVDFFWINREQRSFEWFVSLLSQLEMEQAEMERAGQAAGDRFLELHMYITSALQRADMRAVGLQLALDLLHQKEKRDLITGLKTRTTAGRPNWDKVFQRLRQQNKGHVTVFYCGPPQLARLLRLKCDQYGFTFRKESF